MQSKLDGVFKGIKTAITVAGIAMAVKGIGDALETAASVGDTIDESSQKLGLSRKAYQEWGYVLKQNGGNIESFGVGMKTLQTAMAQGTTQTDAALSKLGLSAAKLKTLSPEDALTETIKAFQKMPAGAEKSALAVDLFGKQGMELLPILNQSSEATEGLIKQANDLGIILNDETIDAGADFSDTLATMKDTITAAGTSFLSSLMPGITKTMDKLIPFFSNVLPKLGEAFGKVLESVAPLVETLVGAFTTVITWIADNAETLIPILEGVAGAILLWNGYQAILNITMAANPIGAVITAVAYLAGGLLLLNSAFSGTNDGMKSFEDRANEIVQNTTDFSDLVSRMTPNILNVNDLISSTGKTVGELQTTIKEKEDAITAILKSAMEDHRGLRQTELDEIAQYNADIASLNEELINQYRSVQIAKLREIITEEGDLSAEQIAQYKIDAEAALNSANDKAKSIYDAEMANLWNKYTAMGQVDSAAHLSEEQAAKEHYQAMLGENKDYYNDALESLTTSSNVLVGVEKKKDADLQIEYQAGLDNLNKHYDQWYDYTYDHYKNVNHMDSEQAKAELAAAQQWLNDELAVVAAQEQPFIETLNRKYESSKASLDSYYESMGALGSAEYQKEVEALEASKQKELDTLNSYAEPKRTAIQEQYNAQYNEIYNHYGRVDELESTEAQAELARIEQERADQTAAWVALYAEKNAAAEAGNAEQMQLTQEALDGIKASQTQFNSDMAAINQEHSDETNVYFRGFISDSISFNNESKGANDKYAAAYRAYLDSLNEVNLTGWLAIIDADKQAGIEISDETKAMLVTLLDNFSSLPADMQDEGYAMLKGLLGGTTDPTIRKILDDEAINTADGVVKAIEDAWDINSPSRVGRGLGSNLVQALAAGMEDERRAAGTKATSIGSWIVQAFKNIFGIHSRSKVMYDEVGGNVMLGITDRIAEGKKTVSNLLNGILPDSLSSSVSLDVTRNYLNGDRAQTEAESGIGGGSSKVVNVQYTNNVYANDTSYAEQQRIAQKSVRKLQEALYGY